MAAGHGNEHGPAPDTGADTGIEGQLLWTPSAQRVRAAGVTAYLEWLAAERGRRLTDATALWQWSVDDLDGFWDSIWDFCAVEGERGDGPALADARMPGARWFPTAQVNYAENALTRHGPAPAVIAVREDATTAVVSWDELRREVAAAAAGLRRLGVGPGDRVCAVLPNCIHAVVAMLATTAVGAVWSSCSPDFGPTGLADRFAQVRPTVLIGVDGYTHGGQSFDTLGVLAKVAERLPGLRATVIVAYLATDALERARTIGLPGILAWEDLLAGCDDAVPTFHRLPFDAPLWILYSSGSTGKPKPIVHGHGGILLEHLKALVLHLDLGPDDRFLWVTSTGWMMWNLLVSGLLAGSTVVLFDGSPKFPDPGALWRLAEATGVTCFGTSPGFLAECARSGTVPREIADLSALRTVGSTGAPLPTRTYAWVYESVGSDLMLSSISGGTEVCTAFVLGLPTLPVRAGEIPMRGLGCAVTTFDEQGKDVVDEVGELVITAPMPSMPVALWGDDDGSLLRAAYFSTYEDVWRHGDWARVTSRGAVSIHGRSDATLNRAGVRIGTAELYQVVENIPGVTDSIVIDTSTADRRGELVLYVCLADDVVFDGVFTETLRAAIRRELSPRHVPDRIEKIVEVPRTQNGKKLEVPVRRLLLGEPLEQAISLGAVANPQALLPFMPPAPG
ncbi:MULTISPECIES: acetoacetate--CoA ligase [Protofrankia]|uniref:acetoacetate--CoA ligase n=1 Tax=Protofrankia TaxID=2994361 RepID=UPI0009F997E3|nr:MULTISPECIES: acetoacetate--CoA ligase [Protofrankia]